MKKQILVLASTLILASAGAVYAACDGDHEGGPRAHSSEWRSDHDGEKGPEHRGMQGMRFLESKLDLTDDQKKKIHAIFDANKPGMDRPNPREELMSLDPSAKDYNAQVQRIAKERAAQVEKSTIAHGRVHAEVYAVLTPDQREKMKLLMQKRHEHMQQKMEGEKAPK